MRAIIAEAERFANDEGHGRQVGSVRGIADAIGRSACPAAESVGAAAIVCLTGSGATPRAIARWRPRQPILAATPSRATWHRLALVWGIEPHLIDEFGSDFDTACQRILAELRGRALVPRGAAVVITAGLPFTQRGGTNTVRIESV